MTMNVCDLLSCDLVLADVDAGDKETVLLALAARVVRHHPEVDGVELREALRQRERQGSTALVDGVAIPHARLAGLPRMVGALARSRAGIDCDSHDGKPTRLFFLLVSPAERLGDHLKALSTVSRLLHDGRCRAELLEADDTEAILRVLGDHAAGIRPAA